jgi:hypothetical protein
VHPPQFAAMVSFTRLRPLATRWPNVVKKPTDPADEFIEGNMQRLRERKQALASEILGASPAKPLAMT